MTAYFTIKNYPVHASTTMLDNYLNQQYKISLKDLCIKILINATFYKDNEGNLIILFKDPKYDKLARLITYGTGAIPGCPILKVALNSK